MEHMPCGVHDGVWKWKWKKRAEMALRATCSLAAQHRSRLLFHVQGGLQNSSKCHHQYVARPTKKYAYGRPLAHVVAEAPQLSGSAP